MGKIWVFFVYLWKIELCFFNKIVIKVIKVVVFEKFIIYFLVLLSIFCVLVFGVVVLVRVVRVVSTEEFVWFWLFVIYIDNS